MLAEINPPARADAVLYNPATAPYASHMVRAIEEAANSIGGADGIDMPSALAVLRLIVNLNLVRGWKRPTFTDITIPPRYRGDGGNPKICRASFGVATWSPNTSMILAAFSTSAALLGAILPFSR
jgi:hypothetical protein